MSKSYTPARFDENCTIYTDVNFVDFVKNIWRKKSTLVSFYKKGIVITYLVSFVLLPDYFPAALFVSSHRTRLTFFILARLTIHYNNGEISEMNCFKLRRMDHRRLNTTDKLASHL